MASRKYTIFTEEQRSGLYKIDYQEIVANRKPLRRSSKSHRRLERQGLSMKNAQKTSTEKVELSKKRAYGEDESALSAAATLSISLSVHLRLLAPFLPFI